MSEVAATAVQDAIVESQRRSPLRIAEAQGSDRVEELIRRLRARIHKGRDLARRQDAIIASQRRRHANLKTALLGQSREIVQLRDRLAEHHLSTEVKL